MDERDCIYPDCLIKTQFGRACEHSCGYEKKKRTEAATFSTGEWQSEMGDIVYPDDEELDFDEPYYKPGS